METEKEKQNKAKNPITTKKQIQNQSKTMGGNERGVQHGFEALFPSLTSFCHHPKSLALHF